MISMNACIHKLGSEMSPGDYYISISFDRCGVGRVIGSVSRISDDCWSVSDTGGFCTHSDACTEDEAIEEFVKYYFSRVWMRQYEPIC